MRTSNGQNSSFKDNCSKTATGLFTIEPKKPNALNSSELEFLDFIKFQGIRELVKSLKVVHDFALYHTDLCFDTKEKNALFNLKILWEALEQLEKS